MNEWEENGERHLVIAPNPSSTYLYTVDEKALLNVICDTVIAFAQANDIDSVDVIWRRKK